MNTIKNTVTGVVGASILVIGGVFLMDSSSEREIKLENPQKIEWVKPTTDEQWAEDVKKENFDLKSDETLGTMIEMHTSKLERLELDFVKYQKCPECIEYDLYEKFINNGFEDAEALILASEEFQRDYDNALRSIEKLKQSIERMNKEVYLREKGFVVTEEKAKKLKRNIDPDKIRKIYD